MFATTIDSVGEYQETLKDLYKTYRDEIVMTGEDNFDSLYDPAPAAAFAAGAFCLRVQKRKCILQLRVGPARNGPAMKRGIRAGE